MSIGKLTLNILIMACLVGLLGCPSEQEPPVEETPRQETIPQTETAPGVEQPADNRETLRGTLQNQYTELEQNIQELQTKSEEIPAEGREEFNQMMESMQRQKNIAKERLDALGTSASEGWEQLKDGAEEALNELQNTYEQVASRFPQAQ